MTCEDLTFCDTCGKDIQLENSIKSEKLYNNYCSKQCKILFEN